VRTAVRGLCDSAAVRLCGSAVHTAVGVAVRAAVYGNVAVCAAVVRQCTVVHAAICGSAHGGVCLFVFNNYIICV
jgi:hypothetical protein